MSRSSFKIPIFKNNYKFFETLWVRHFQKNQQITHNDLNLTYYIYNGKSFIKLKIQNEMIGYKFGEFIKTKSNMNKNRYLKKKNIHGKKKHTT